MFSSRHTQYRTQELFTVTPAFETAALQGTPHFAWDAQVPCGFAKTIRMAGGTSAALAAGLACVAGFIRPEQSSLPWIALALAAAAVMLLRLASFLEWQGLVVRGFIDAATGLHNRLGLYHAGADMQARAKARGKSLSLVVLDFDDLLELRDIYGRDVAGEVYTHVVRRVQSIAGGRGIAARSGRTQFTVLLPGLNREQAQARVQRRLGKPCSIEFDAGDDEIVLVPDIFCVPAGAAAGTIDGMVRLAASKLTALREREERRRLYLQRERERHSRPMSVPPSTIR